MIRVDNFLSISHPPASGGHAEDDDEDDDDVFADVQE